MKGVLCSFILLFLPLRHIGLSSFTKALKYIFMKSENYYIARKQVQGGSGHLTFDLNYFLGHQRHSGDLLLWVGVC